MIQKIFGFVIGLVIFILLLILIQDKNTLQEDLERKQSRIDRLERNKSDHNQEWIDCQKDFSKKLWNFKWSKQKEFDDHLKTH